MRSSASGPLRPVNMVLGAGKRDMLIEGKRAVKSSRRPSAVMLQDQSSPWRGCERSADNQPRREFRAPTTWLTFFVGKLHVNVMNGMWRVPSIWI